MGRRMIHPSLFDLAAGLVLIVSALVGWIRGASREVATAAAILIAAVAALAALRFTGPVARHAVATPWIANIAAILIVFVAVYILLRVLAAGLTRQLHQTSGLGGLDRTVGAGFGVARALVILGLASLTINAIVPADRMPTWISGAFLVPVTLLELTFGVLGDLFGRKRLLIIGAAMLAVGQGIALLTPGLGTSTGTRVAVLWIGMAVAGGGAAAIMPTSPA